MLSALTRMQRNIRNYCYTGVEIKTPRESQLQKEILALLSGTHEPLNITRIARELGKHRSSVSRSVALLKGRNLIHESNHAYQIATEVAMMQGALREAETMRKMVEAAKAMSTIHISTETIESAVRAASMIPFQDIARSMRPLIESAAFNENVIRQYSEVSSKVFQNVDLSMLAATADLAKVASMMTDMIPKFDISPIFDSVSFLTKHQNLLDQFSQSCLPETISLYGSFLDEAVRFELTETRIENISAPTSEIIDSVSYSIADEADDEIPKSMLDKPVLLDEGNLDRFLKEINPRFPDIRVGAWDAFRSGGRDKDRQACHSMRELLNQVIDEIMPDELKMKAKKGKKEDRPTRKEKIRSIVGSDSEAKLIDAQARLYDETYYRLSAISHSRTENEALSVEFALASGQNILAYILFYNSTGRRRRSPLK